MTQHCNLSIIIITYNGASYLDRLLSSLAPYLNGCNDVEIVIVDNASTDSTDQVISKWQKQHGDKIKVHTSDKNLGVAPARKLGTSISSGKIIMYLDNDTVVSSEAIINLRTYIENHPDCGVVAPALRSPDGELQDSAKQFPGIGVKFRNLFLRNMKKVDVDYGKEDVFHPYYVIGACQMFRRATYDAIGGLDSHIFYGPEDADFCERIRRKGFSIDYLQTTTVIHDWQRATRRSPFSNLSRQHIKGLIYFYIKHKRLF